MRVVTNIVFNGVVPKFFLGDSSKEAKALKNNDDDIIRLDWRKSVPMSFGRIVTMNA